MCSVWSPSHSQRGSVKNMQTQGTPLFSDAIREGVSTESLSGPAPTADFVFLQDFIFSERIIHFLK